MMDTTPPRMLTVPGVIMMLAFAALMQFSAVTQSYAQGARQMTLEERHDLLRQQHRAIYALPQPKEFIYDELMPKITEQRKTVAPHFPERGGDEAATKSNIDYWLTEYPEELDAYVRLVGEHVSKYANRKTRK
jgi:hypothetical protein